MTNNVDISVADVLSDAATVLQDTAVILPNTIHRATAAVPPKTDHYDVPTNTPPPPPTLAQHMGKASEEYILEMIYPDI